MHKGYRRVGSIHHDPARAVHALKLVDVHTPEAIETVGAWRWPALASRAAGLVPILRQPYVVDLGGSAGPVGYGAVVVDYEEPDRKTLFDLPGRPDAVFMAHTLEHVEDADLLLATVARKLRPQGACIILVPSWKNERLRHRNWPFHAQTFRLTDDPDAPGDAADLEALVGEHFAKVHVCEYAERDHLFVLAETAAE